MKTLVVCESMFGNTEQIANAVAAGLGESVDDVDGPLLDGEIDRARALVGSSPRR
jgi:flavodoxin